MAQYKHLPIYKTTYELLEMVTRKTKDNMYKRTALQSDFKPLRATINSYFGMLRHANAFKERKRAAMHLGKSGCWFDGQLTKLVRLGEPLCTFASPK